jgi:hypothetical protein
LEDSLGCSVLGARCSGVVTPPLEALDQGVQEAAGSPGGAHGVSKKNRIGSVEAMAQQEKSFHLGDGAQGDGEMVDVVPKVLSPVALGDVRGHGDRGSPELTSQAVHLVPWQSVGNGIRGLGEAHPELPRQQIPIGAHHATES